MIWMHRIDGIGEAPAGLEVVPHDTLADTCATREVLDARMIATVDGMDEAALAELIRFKARSGYDIAIPTNLIVANLCNHQTHHRGHVHAMQTSLCQEVSPFDFFPFLMATGRAQG